MTDCCNLFRRNIPPPCLFVCVSVRKSEGQRAERERELGAKCSNRQRQGWDKSGTVSPCKLTSLRASVNGLILLINVASRAAAAAGGGGGGQVLWRRPRSGLFLSCTSHAGRPLKADTPPHYHPLFLCCYQSKNCLRQEIRAQGTSHWTAHGRYFILSRKDFVWAGSAAGRRGVCSFQRPQKALLVWNSEGLGQGPQVQVWALMSGEQEVRLQRLINKTHSIHFVQKTMMYHTLVGIINPTYWQIKGFNMYLLIRQTAESNDSHCRSSRCITKINSLRCGCLCKKTVARKLQRKFASETFT